MVCATTGSESEVEVGKWDTGRTTRGRTRWVATPTICPSRGWLWVVDPPPPPLWDNQFIRVVLFCSG